MLLTSLSGLSLKAYHSNQFSTFDPSSLCQSYHLPVHKCELLPLSPVYLSFPQSTMHITSKSLPALFMLILLGIFDLLIFIYLVLIDFQGILLMAFSTHLASQQFLTPGLLYPSVWLFPESRTQKLLKDTNFLIFYLFVYSVSSIMLCPQRVC